MATINVYNGKKGKTYRVQIRRTGHPIISESFKSLREARYWAKIIEAGLATPNPLMQIKDHLDTVKTVSSHLETSYTMQDRILKYWEQKLGSLKLTEITPKLINQHRDALLKVYETGTARRSLALLGSMLNVAYKDYEWFPVNPMSKVRKPRDSKPRQRYLSDEEWSRLLTACKASTHRMLYPITILSLATGARYSELINLKLSNVDFQRNIVYFYKTNNQQPNSIILS